MNIIIILALIIIFAGLTSRRNKYDKAKEEWEKKNCSKGQHFVGECVYHGYVECEICHACPKWVSKKTDSYGTPVSWKW